MKISKLKNVSKNTADSDLRLGMAEGNMFFQDHAMVPFIKFSVLSYNYSDQTQHLNDRKVELDTVVSH